MDNISTESTGQIVRLGDCVKIVIDGNIVKISYIFSVDGNMYISTNCGKFLELSSVRVLTEDELCQLRMEQ